MVGKFTTYKSEELRGFFWQRLSAVATHYISLAAVSSRSLFARLYGLFGLPSPSDPELRWILLPDLRLPTSDTVGSRLKDTKNRIYHHVLLADCSNWKCRLPEINFTFLDLFFGGMYYSVIIWPNSLHYLYFIMCKELPVNGLHIHRRHWYPDFVIIMKRIHTRLGCFYVTAILSWG